MCSVLSRLEYRQGTSFGGAPPHSTRPGFQSSYSPASRRNLASGTRQDNHNAILLCTAFGLDAVRETLGKIIRRMVIIEYKIETPAPLTLRESFLIGTPEPQHPLAEPDCQAKMMLDQYTYVFAIGTFFALLDAFNNGASKFSCEPRSTRYADDSQTMSPTPGPPVSRRGQSLTVRP